MLVSVRNVDQSISLLTGFRKYNRQRCHWNHAQLMNKAHVPFRGVALAITATAMFALVSPYVKLLQPLSGLDIFAWRAIWTLPCILLLAALQKRLGKLRALATEM